jgi:hypothetical protein
MQGKHLLYREDLKLFAAVGKFHLGARVLECFWEFSLNFIEGSGGWGYLRDIMGIS